MRADRNYIFYIKLFASFLSLLLFAFILATSQPNKEAETERISAPPQVMGETLTPLDDTGLIPSTDVADKSLFTVVDVVDGDTIKIDNMGTTETVRLIGLDTPETKDPRKPVQCFGAEAEALAKELLLNKKVYLLPDPTQDDVDKYDRILRYVIREDGYFYNYQMLVGGYAYEYTYAVPYEFQAQFKAAEKNARSQSIGLFGAACACAETKYTEASRSCVACNQAVVLRTNWDCSTYEETVEDPSCIVSCVVPQAVEPVAEPTVYYEPVVESTSPPVPSFTCSCSKTCKQMLSCEEAYYQLNQCGCAARDGDSDGIPCEDIC